MSSNKPGNTIAFAGLVTSVCCIIASKFVSDRLKQALEVGYALSGAASLGGWATQVVADRTEKQRAASQATIQR